MRRLPGYLHMFHTKMFHRFSSFYNLCVRLKVDSIAPFFLVGQLARPGFFQYP